MTASKQRHICIITGEHSGDIHGAACVQHFLSKHPDTLISGMGGQHMQQAGVDVFLRSDVLGVVGFMEVLYRLPRILSARKQVHAFLKRQRPDLLILIDSAGFNLRLAKTAKQLGIPVLYYIGPQIWASRYGRIHAIKRWVDHMAVIFDFEYPIYTQAGIPVTWVGHPLCHQVAVHHQPPALKKMLGIHPLASKTICLMPGSRLHEIKRLLPAMVAGFMRLKKQHPDWQGILAVASNIDLQHITPYIQHTGITAIQHNTHKAIALSDMVITASGTATLEIALLGKPMVIVYRLSAVTYHLAKRLVRIPFIGLVNIVLNEAYFPELIQHEVTGEAIARLTAAWVHKDPKAIQKKLHQIQQRLLKGPDVLTELIEECLEKSCANPHTAAE